MSRPAAQLALLASLGLVLGLAEVGLAQGPRFFREGTEAYRRRDFDAAIQAYTRAIESGDLPHPDLFFAFNNRGNAYSAKQDYDHALRDYSEALRINPKFAGALRNRGITYLRQGDADRAFQDFTEAARLDPDDPHALIGRGFIYCERREFDLAVSDFDAALRVCPTCPLAVKGRTAAAAGRDCR